MTVPPTPLTSPSSNGVRIVGRYALYSEFAAGGMASVHFGRLLGAAGFSRTVAVKRLHPQFAKDPEFVSMFVDEARLAARIRHPNVVQTLDVVQVEHELFLVMDYVHGDSLANLLKKAQARGQKVPGRVAITMLKDALFGLHAAHSAKTEHGEPLEIVHRDMSPHNVLVGVDGAARVLDFGIAKAGGRVQVTRDGQVKGKLSYLAPEQLTSEHAVDRRADIYAAAATLWEALTGRRLVQGESDWQRVTQICAGELVAPSQIEPAVPAALDAVVMKGLARNPADRYATARDMALALEGVGEHVAHASAREVGEWVEEIGGDSLKRRASHVAQIESHSAENAPTSLGDEPTLTRSDIGSLIVAESSANRNSAPAAMARSLSSAPPPTPRASFPSFTSIPGSGSRSVPRVSIPVPGAGLGAGDASVPVDAEEEPSRSRALPLLLLLAAGVAACAVYIYFARPDLLGRLETLAGLPGNAIGGSETAGNDPSGNASPVDGAPRTDRADGHATGTVTVAGGASPTTAQGEAAMAVPALPASVPSVGTSTGSRVGTSTSAGGPPSGAAPASPGVVQAATALAITPALTPAAPWKAWKAPPTSGASAAASPSRECDVPYTIDPQGIRHPKPQCL